MAITLWACAGKEEVSESPQFHDGKYHNSKPIQTESFSETLAIAKDYILEKRTDANPLGEIPVRKLDKQTLLADAEHGDAIYRLGHSSLLLAIEQEFWLLDPVFSERASPFSFIGPKRFHQPPIQIDELPPIKGVIISHNHYDHLDKSAVKTLQRNVELFITPLGVGQTLQDWGIAKDKIREMDWWQSSEHGRLKITATPSQHFSGRSLTDGNKTLWASWVLQSPSQNIFFSGDTGYFDGFKQIGKKYGPFDITLMETGAYDKRWKDVHMMPEETLQAHQDLNGKALLPIHNGTFDLAFHTWYEPFEKISKLAQQAKIQLLTPAMGEKVNLSSPNNMAKWWRQVSTEVKQVFVMEQKQPVNMYEKS